MDWLVFKQYIYGRASINFAHVFCRRIFLSYTIILRVYGRASVNFAHVFCRIIFLSYTIIPRVYRRASINLSPFLGLCNLCNSRIWLLWYYILIYKADFTLECNLVLFQVESSSILYTAK